MSHIDDLIAKLCPKGVESTAIGELITYEQPNKYLVSSKEYDPTYPTPVLTAGQTFILGYTNEIQGIYPASKTEPVIIFDDFTTAHKWVDFSFKAKSGAMKMLRPSAKSRINFKFFYYLLNTIEIDHSQHARYWISEFAPMKIPVPPLEIQDEIVGILDRFTQLDAELVAELKARKIQYEFFRESLFSSHISTQKSLDSVSSIWRGRRFVKDDIRSEGIPAIHYGEIYTKYGLSATESFSFLDPELASKLRFASPGDVVLVSAGETIEDIGKSLTWLGDEDVVIHDACFGIRSSEINPRYMVHFFNTHNFRSQLRKYISSSKISAISTEKLGKVLIPVPSPKEQIAIADALDSIECLVSDLRVGLPGEIAARRQQFEYFRGKLLTFKELEVA